MTAVPGDFDEDAERVSWHPLLPQEDRLWRHPSELGARGIDAVALGSRWVLRHPSRRSALTAGLVGALLATGVVAVATHLADAMNGTKATPVRPTVTTSAIRAAVLPEVSGPIAGRIARTSQAMASVEVARGDLRSRVLGLVVRSDGMLLVPTASVAGAASLVVTLADGDVYVGSLVASDPTSGLSIVRISGVKGLSTVRFATAPVRNHTYALDVTAPGETVYSLGTVDGLDVVTRVGGHALIGEMTTDLASAASPAGSPLLSSTGAVEGVVTGAEAGTAVAAPSWLAAPVASELERGGTVVHGWLGLRCEQATAPLTGVEVTSVGQRGAGAKAGIRAGDVIVSIDRQRIGTVSALRARLYALAPGARVRLLIERGRHRFERVVVLRGSADI